MVALLGLFVILGCLAAFMRRYSTAKWLALKSSSLVCYGLAALCSPPAILIYAIIYLVYWR